ncbi:MAG: DUF5615 family PIN-like protein [Phycisphaerae bacterium]|nr:DUF5615 family PIN-like protein [Phycisphaerae bacterium]
MAPKQRARCALCGRISRGTSDDDLLATARQQDRLLITDDKDFGELVFHQRLVTRGVVLIRLQAMPLPDRLRRLSEVWADIERSPNTFIVISDRKVRVRGLLRGE